MALEDASALSNQYCCSIDVHEWSTSQCHSANDRHDDRRTLNEFHLSEIPDCSHTTYTGAQHMFQAMAYKDGVPANVHPTSRSLPRLFVELVAAGSSS